MTTTPDLPSHLSAAGGEAILPADHVAAIRPDDDALTALPVPLVAVLEALRISLTQATRHPVSIGVPAGPQPGIWLWPWRLTVDPIARQPAPRPAAPGAQNRPLFTKVVDVIVLVEPATDAAWLSLLDAALDVLQDSLVLQVDAGTANVLPSILSAADLCAVFQASGVRLLPVVTASVRFVSN